MSGHGTTGIRPRGASDLALNRLTGWYAIGLRAGGAAFCAVAGPLAATPGVSQEWLGVSLAVLTGWSALFAWLVWREGLRWPLALADAVVIGALVTAHRHVVPADLIAAGTTWMLPLASTSVFILQLAVPPVASLAAAGALTAVYFMSAPHPTGAWILLVQAVATAAMMALLRRAGRNAEAAISAELLAGQELRAAAARRADEREAYRQLHDTVLSTLTMVASRAFSGPSPTLSAQAARDMEVLAGPGGTAAARGPEHRALGERLRQVAADAAPLRVRLHLMAVSVPSAVMEPIAWSVAEALRNVTRHAGTGEAEVSVRGTDGSVLVEVTDQGSGFDPSALRPGARGLRESIAGRMSDVGGAAEIVSARGQGTRVVLRWPG
jgi:signal transduction histidine kinase